MEKNNNTKLLIIGNGFDLHLKVKSSFNDFFKYIENDKESNFIKSNGEEFVLFNDFIKSISDKNERAYEISASDPLDEYVDTFRYDNLEYDESPKLPKLNQLNRNGNFWCIYFKYLKQFPTHMKHTPIYEKEYKNTEKINQYMNDWSNIEYQLKQFFINNEEYLTYYDHYMHSCIQVLSNFTKQDFSSEYINEYFGKLCEKDADGVERMTYMGALRLLFVYLAIVLGYKPKDDIYDFLYKELLKFEMKFKKYIKSQIGLDYKQQAKNFALELVNENKSDNYNLINFNYTNFYNSLKSNKLNIHSDLNNNGHPIFGIGSLSENETRLTDKRYYKFTKSYRTLKLANSKYKKYVLSSNINTIIFFGHSLSEADYSYLSAIFDYYDVCDMNNNMQVLFKYIEYDEYNYGKEFNHQLIIVHNFINRYAKENNYNNLFSKLRFKNKLTFEEIHPIF